MFFYVTPSQLVLLHDLFTRLVSKNSKSNENKHVYGGKPMQPEHFQKLTEQFYNELQLPTVQPFLGGWGGQTQFYELPSSNLNGSLIKIY